LLFSLLTCCLFLSSLQYALKLVCMCVVTQQAGEKQHDKGRMWYESNWVDINRILHHLIYLRNACPLPQSCGASLSEEISASLVKK
jgi:hypothetical protein